MITGEQNLGPQPTSIHQLHRLSSVKSIIQCYQMTIEAVETVTKGTDDQAITIESREKTGEFVEGLLDALKHLLLKYRRVFDVPKGLPPVRIFDHKIPLQPNSIPVKVRPYRYHHSQKTEIKIMVDQMLQKGLIEPSNSPFSSPVILVKKKDGTWRFCTDYRALNGITILDAYPIPIVNELLDELNGVKYFSKLDLRSRYHQVLICAKNKHKTAFRTHHGHF